MTLEFPRQTGDKPARKPYESPRLEVYGDIREIARAMGHTGNLDNGAHGLKTQ